MATLSTHRMLRGGDSLTIGRLLQNDNNYNNQDNDCEYRQGGNNPCSGYNPPGGNDESSGTGFVSTSKVYINSIFYTNPREWGTNQWLGVASAALGILTILLMLCCCRGWSAKRQTQKRKDEDNAYMNMSLNDNKEALLKQHQKDPKTFQHQMKRPAVVRGPVPATTYGAGYDASDANRLPLGARLHGAQKLRTNNLKGQGVRVAVIDSGIDHTHPGLHDKVRTKRWFRYGTPLEEDDHGTHVAGTIHFLAPEADLYDYRVFGKDGDYDGDVAIAKSIRSAVDVDKCHIINLSLRCSYPVSSEITKAVQYAYKKGVHMVCAAGNDGDGNSATDEPFTFPARFAETISVAAVRKESGLPPAGFSESNPQVVYSGIGTDVVSLKPFGGLQTMSGTSMATPHVAGLIACLLSQNPTKYSDRQLRKLLKQEYLVDIGPRGFDKQTGEGFVTYLAGDAKKKAGGADDASNELFDLLSLV